jgi:hypothetical protein
MDYSHLFDDAISLAFQDIISGKFELKSEKDLQALVFFHSLLIADQNGMDRKIHAEPTNIAIRPDLVFGDDEVFFETKLSKAGSGGYTVSIGHWRADATKLARYKAAYPNARCVFLGIDEAGYFAKDSLKNHFNPLEVNLKGTWKSLFKSTYFILAEI